LFVIPLWNKTCRPTQNVRKKSLGTQQSETQPIHLFHRKRINLKIKEKKRKKLEGTTVLWQKNDQFTLNFAQKALALNPDSNSTAKCL
jgi:hypothetical protein